MTPLNYGEMLSEIALVIERQSGFSITSQTAELRAQAIFDRLTAIGVSTVLIPDPTRTWNMTRLEKPPSEVLE